MNERKILKKLKYLLLSAVLYLVAVLAFLSAVFPPFTLVTTVNALVTSLLCFTASDYWKGKLNNEQI